MATAQPVIIETNLV